MSKLASAPDRFAASLSRLEDADSVTRSGSGEWSPVEIVAHVRASGDILESRIFFILARDSPPLIAYDERVWAEVTHYASLPVMELVQTMKSKRRELVHMLRGITPAGWDRTGVHEVRGPITLMDVARHIANHEDEHIAQIEQMVG
jgi:hypothetical protein